MTTKRCRDCGVDKPVDQFYVYRAKGKNPRPYSYCADCTKKKARGYREKNPELCRNVCSKWYSENKVRALQDCRNYRLKKKFGISQDDFNAMLEAQGGSCAICGRGGNGEHLCVDHCHDTGKIRGLLCKACNMGLGNFKDDVHCLRTAAEYLARSYRA